MRSIGPGGPWQWRLCGYGYVATGNSMKKYFPITQFGHLFDTGEQRISSTYLAGVIGYRNEDFAKIAGFSLPKYINNCHNLDHLPQALFSDMWHTLEEGVWVMHSAKANKYTSSNWWRQTSSLLPVSVEDGPIDAYGGIAKDLLQKVGPHWETLGVGFVEEFYGRILKRPSAARVLGVLTSSEMGQLKLRQANHFKLIISPFLDADSHKAVAQHLGEIHAMLGVETSDIMAATDEYGRLLRQAGQRLPWRRDAKLALDSIILNRLATELHFQSHGRDVVEQQRTAILARLELNSSGWVKEGDLGSKVASYLADMPCVSGVAIGRPNERDEFVIEFAAGAVEEYMHLEVNRKHAFAGASQKPAMTSWRRAWMTGQIDVSDNLIAEGTADEDRTLAEQHRLRSSASLPILDSQSHPLIVVTLFGAYPGQFSQSVMRMWLDSVMHALTPAFQRMEKGGATPPINAAMRQHYHTLLFDDRLQIMIQPIVTLATGKVEKVEVLARLRDEERLIGPGEFLPTFGQQDLQALFRKGLRDITDWLVRWDSKNIHLDANLNLPPSVLISSDCVRWIEEELQNHNLSPERIYLELLENEDDALDPTKRDIAVKRLAALGVRLVMDDLGSGYSSLQRLRTLPFKKVKIDQELVKNAPSDPERTVPFIGSLVRMAQALGLKVVIEGLETCSMAEMAAILGAEYGQGFVCAKPFLPELFLDWVRQRDVPTSLTSPTTDLGQHALAFRSSFNNG